MGDLAKTVHRAQTVKKISKMTLIGLGISAGVIILTIPFTGGASIIPGSAALAAGGTGGTGGTAGAAGAALIILASCLGAGLLLAILQKYEEIEFKIGPEPKLVLRRKK